MQNKDALARGIYHSEKSFSAGDRFPGKERLLYRSAEKRYERYVWTEKGEVYFSEEAALDHAVEYGEWPEEHIRRENPDDIPWSPFTGYTDGTGQR